MAAMSVDRNSKIFLLWEFTAIFMQMQTTYISGRLFDIGKFDPESNILLLKAKTTSWVHCSPLSKQ